VRPGCVVVRDVRRQHPEQMPGVPDQHPVQHSRRVVPTHRCA
jgi:hypothetical protein